MKLGLNISFAVKRWMEPGILARMCKNDFDVDHIQFSWDFIDPWWPTEQRDYLARKFKHAFDEEGVKIDSSFAGNAAYTFAHFLAPTNTQRDISLEYFKRAIDMSLILGATVIGSPVGGMSNQIANDHELRHKAYEEMLGYLRTLAEYGKTAGLKEIEVEATPLITEFPYNPEMSVMMMKDLEGTAIPIKLLIDWGHALFKPLLKEEADINLWFKKCAPYIGAIHLQQTDGLWDRHWDFTNKEGIVTPKLILDATKAAGLDDVYQYLEVITIYEDDDSAVFRRMKQTMDYLHRELHA